MRVALLVALLCSSCMPVVQHGPWVRPGMSGAIGASAAVTGSFDGTAGLQPFFSFDGGMRAGITPKDSTYDGLSVGVQLPLIALLADAYDESDDLFGFAGFLNVDAYVTGPRINERRTAGGLAISRYHTMPYIQFGELDDWYGTLSVMLLRESDVVIVAPSFTDVRRTGDRSVSHLTLTAGVGRGDGETVFLAGLSLIFEFHGKNARP
jgi:hypothetical protein